MSLTLAELQSKFQDGVLNDDQDVLNLIRKPPTDTSQKMFGVYRNAYVVRLIEFLANDHQWLKLYLGNEEFEKLARAFIRANQSDQPNARWFSRHFPDFLSHHNDCKDCPEVAELALLERALNSAFDAKDVRSLSVTDLSLIDPSVFEKARFTFHPSVTRLQFSKNVLNIWSSLRNGKPAPEPSQADSSLEVLVWRQAMISRFRQLDSEEAMAFDEARNGLPFGVLCEMIAMMANPEHAAIRAAAYLRAWLESELICSIET